MGRVILIMLFGIVMIGCTDSVRIRTEVQESFVPVLYCPAPTKHTRPIMAINQMTDAQRKVPGELAKYYQATVEQLIGYSKQLELELEKYNTSNQAYEDLRIKMDAKFKADGVATEKTLIDQNKLDLQPL